ncbi:hypothetical protein P175DRAFT_0426610 [Aspergillus ochraceoroseus IBT 24754]|uniref:F-box domain-containing protein n=1 Tax=Aspergillus ochraceoroseus IBT 24754 TaxID=1392256 RepID=A0A2T5M937_9EURO|nr:uncharacterized protein P175DRAFT_0426610 [Aspergillus ochraceoroseus IBT 24754]PTU25050.1 hypothetical protein P175DRAFT_0426610 [Aspergillus ochraceoroseus IBT 24754]
MEEDVRLPCGERLELVQPDPIQTQQPERNGPKKKHPATPVRQTTTATATTPFGRLPRTVIEYILFVVDASAFASLSLLNRKWRRISDSSLLYSHHLSQCPSFSLSQKATAGPAQPDDLALLKHTFFSEIRRNGFDVFLRPHRTLIKLMSTSMSSSTAFPHGEAFRFSFSQNAQLILCISSSRIVVLDVASDLVSVRHELKTWRRPLHATILDDGSLLAVASSTHRVNIYSLSNAQAKLVQNLKLNDVPRALTLSPNGGVLAIAYNDMVEVYAIGEGLLATERRAVRCAGVDSISFSSDGVILLGSSANCETGSLVTITIPFYSAQETDFSGKEVQIQMWTTQILFPDIVQGYSHACLLPLHAEGEGNWILGFDNQIGAFRAVGISNANSGTAYFTSPVSEDGFYEQAPMMPATSDYQGELIALGFQNSGLWVYGVPDRLDIAPVVSNTGDMQPLSNSSRSQAATMSALGTTLDRLQRVVTRPKILIQGHKMTDMPGITAARWVRQSHSRASQRRLAAVAPGGVDPSTIGEEDVPVDGGRVLLLDFARSAKNGATTEINIEIGEAEPMNLPEPSSSLDTEVELERRRTRVIRGRSTGVTSRGTRDSYPAASSSAHARPRRNSAYFSATSSEPGEADVSAFPESPYDNTQPRSQDTLRRAATAAAANRRRERLREEPRRVFDGQPPPTMFQIPHESDADNWVPPPPPYSREADAPLPEYLRRTLIPQAQARRTGNASGSVRRSLSTRIENMMADSSSRSSIYRLNTVTGPRIASRMGRHLGDSPENFDNPRRQTSFLERRDNSTTRQPQTLSDISEPTVPLPQPQPPVTPPLMVQNITDLPVEPNPAVLISPSAQTGSPPIQHSWQHHLPSIPTAPLIMGNYLFSVSSPDLQSENTQLVVPEAMRIPPMRHDYIRPIDRPSQSHDIRPPVATMPPRHRRASTDPTHSSSQSVTTDQWRRRIEDWNERTIYERNKRRSKCIIM